MAISDTQKIDLLLKKVGYGVAKTDTATIKSPANEAIASPLLIRGDLIWANSEQVPASPPASSTAIVTVYTGAAARACTADVTSSTNRTWKTGLIDWIPVEFGASYQVAVWAGSPTGGGTQLFPDGSGNNDSWYFDYQSGVLNFADTNIPSAVAGKTIYIEGYRYAGVKGLSSALSLGFVSQGTDPSNWDQNTTFGIYYVNRVSWSGTAGSPTEAAPVGLLSVLVSEGMVVQKYQPNDTTSLMGSEWARTKSPSGSWTPWARTINDVGLTDGGSF